MFRAISGAVISQWYRRRLRDRGYQRRVLLMREDQINGENFCAQQLLSKVRAFVPRSSTTRQRATLGFTLSCR